MHLWLFPFVDRDPQSWVPSIFQTTEEDFVPATHEVPRKVPGTFDRFRKYVQEEVPGEVEIRTEIVVGTFGEYFNVAAIDTTAPKGTRLDDRLVHEWRKCHVDSAWAESEAWHLAGTFAAAVNFNWERRRSEPSAAE